MFTTPKVCAKCTIGAKRKCVASSTLVVFFLKICAQGEQDTCCPVKLQILTYAKTEATTALFVLTPLGSNMNTIRSTLSKMGQYTQS